jgi:hypothetical protein
MATVYRTFPLDTKNLDRDIDAGKIGPEDIGRGVGTSIDRLLRGNLEAAKGAPTTRGYPSEILVGGKNDEEVKRGFQEAIKGTGVGDYLSEQGGKTYTR